MRVLPESVSFCLGVAASVWSLSGCQSPSDATTQPEPDKEVARVASSAVAHDTNETPTPVESSASAPRPAAEAEDGEGDQVEARQAVASPRSTTKIGEIEDGLKPLEAIPSAAASRNF